MTVFFSDSHRQPVVSPDRRDRSIAVRAEAIRWDACDGENPLVDFCTMPDIPPNSVQVESRNQWRAWLAENHERVDGIWLITYKKSAADKYLSNDDIVEEALCFGWIDSLPRRLDDQRTMLYLAPRNTGSGWSRVNKERIERMIAAQKMMPAGLAKIEAAKADGSWTKLDAIENLEIPDDLADEFRKYPDAACNFDAFPRSAKRGILEWIASAKRDATRSKRVEETARLADQNIRANQWTKRSGKPTNQAAARKPTGKMAEKNIAAKTKLLSGGNPQIAKADGDVPVQAYIAAMPGWKGDVGRTLDALIVHTVPNVRKAVRWNSPFYGIEGQGWFLSYHCFTKYIKVTFLNGASLRPLPPVAAKHQDARYYHIHENDQIDEALVASWIKQASELPGEDLF